MAVYIEKQAAIDAIPKPQVCEYMDEFGAGRNSCAYDAEKAIEAIPAADVVPVVRCDNCKYYGSRRWCELHSSVFDDNAFCSYGERE